MEFYNTFVKYMFFFFFRGMSSIGAFKRVRRYRVYARRVSDANEEKDD